MKRLILVLTIFGCLTGCSSYFWNPTGTTAGIYKDTMDPWIGQEMDTVMASMEKMWGALEPLAHYEVVDPNPSEWTWTADRPVFYPKGSAAQAMSEKGTYDILVFHRDRRQVDMQRGYNYFNVSPAQRKHINPRSTLPPNLQYVMLFERIQLTFRDKKLVHWCVQMIL